MTLFTLNLTMFASILDMTNFMFGTFERIAGGRDWGSFGLLGLDRAAGN